MTSAVGRAKEHQTQRGWDAGSPQPPEGLTATARCPSSLAAPLPACSPPRRWPGACPATLSPLRAALFLRPASYTSTFRQPAQEALTKRVGGGVGGGLRGQDDELCRAVLGQGEDGGHGAWHGGGEAWGQVLV